MYELIIRKTNCWDNENEGVVRNVLENTLQLGQNNAKNNYIIVKL